MTEETWSGCTTDGNPPLIGQEYRIRHSRKGTFFGVVESINGPWVTAVISDGMAKAMMDYNVKLEGERVTVRNSMCRMDPVKSSQVSPQ